jgi:hypothetical protein
MIPLIHEQKKSTPLIEIIVGTSMRIFATTSKSPVIWNGETYMPEPTIEIDLPKQSGALGEEECPIRLPMVNNLHPGIAVLAQMLAQPRSAPPISVKVTNLIESGPDNVIPVYLYDGVLIRSVANPRKQEGFVEAVITPEFLHQLEDATLGHRADPSCNHVFGGAGCWHPDVNTFFSTPDVGFQTRVRKLHVLATVFPSEAGARQVTLSIDPSYHPAPASSLALTQRPEGWWKRAFLEKDGLRIQVSDWRWNTTIGTGTNIFILNRIPPADWCVPDTQLILHPGCSRSPEACAQRANSTFFGGYGYGIPAYNPTIETDDR